MPASARSLPAVRPSVRKLSRDLVALRRDLHRHPELSWQEKRTREVILDRLRAWGLEDVRPIADTGAPALVPGGPPAPPPPGAPRPGCGVPAPVAPSSGGPTSTLCLSRSATRLTTFRRSP